VSADHREQLQRVIIVKVGFQCTDATATEPQKGAPILQSPYTHILVNNILEIMAMQAKKGIPKNATASRQVQLVLQA